MPLIVIAPVVCSTVVSSSVVGVVLRFVVGVPVVYEHIQKQSMGIINLAMFTIDFLIHVDVSESIVVTSKHIYKQTHPCELYIHEKGL